MGKQKIKPGSFVQSPVTALAKRTPQGDFRSPNSITQAQGIKQATTTDFDNITESPFAKDYFSPKIFGFTLDPVDESANDPYSYHDPLNSGIDFEKIRADRQSTFNKIGATATQFVGKTAMSTVGNIVGGFYGLGSAIAKWDSTPIYDNPIYRSVDEANESIEANNSVFLNRKEGLGFNFGLVKDLADAFQFIASAVLSETAIAAVSAGTGLSTLGARAGRYLGKAAALGKKLEQAQDLEELALQLGTTVDKLSKVKRNLDAVGAVGGMGRKILTTTGYEASLEARHASDEFLQNTEHQVDSFLRLKTDWTEEEKMAYKANFMAKAQRDAEAVGLTTFMLNTAVLSVSNVMQFPTIFGSSYLNAKRLKALERTGLGTVAAAKNSSKFVRGVATVGRVLENPLVEMTEEMVQKVISEGTKHHYESVLGTDSNTDVLLPASRDFANSLWHGLKEGYGTKEGWYEGMIGAIIGGLGMPGFKRVGEKTKLDWKGGIYEDLKKIRETKQYTESSIDAINNSNIGDALKYKRDNAIISTLDADKEDVAVLKEDELSFEDVQDNKVFRYTSERMKRGLDNTIDEDVKELQDMSLEQYKGTFQKEDSFTQEDKDTEVQNFADKTKIYKDAFKTVHKSLDFGRYSVDSVAHDKLTDILTHAVATQKIYGDKLESQKQELSKQGVSPEAIDTIIKTSGKVRAAQAELDAYIKEKQQDASAVIRESFDPEYQGWLELSKDELKERKTQFEETENKTETIEKHIKTLDKLIKAKDSYEEAKKFNPKKSSIARKKIKTIEELTDEVNKKVEQRTSQAMKELGALPEKVTTKELSEYLFKKIEIANQIAKEVDSTYVIEKPVGDGATVDSIENLTDRFVLATKIAASLYGFNDAPASLYSRIKAGKLFADIDNAKRKIYTLHFMQASGASIETMKPYLDDLEATYEVIKKDYEEVRDRISEKSKELAKEAIKNLEMFFTHMGIELKNREELDNQVKKAKVNKVEEPSVLEAAEKAGLFKTKEEEEDIDPNDTEQTTRRHIQDEYNRLTIRETTLEGTAQLSNPNFPTLQEAIEQGIIRNKAVTTITLQEDQLDPEKNKGLKEHLLKVKALEAYKRGHEKLSDDSKSIANYESDKDIKAFVDNAPIYLNIYNKEATKKGKIYDFEIDKKDKIVYQQYLYAVENLSKEELAENETKFNAGLAELNVWKAEELENKERSKKEINDEFNARLEALENKVYWKQRGISSNHQMRLDLIKNFLSGTNMLKLKVHNVDQGNFENFKGKKKVVHENDVTELGFTKDTHHHDILYANQKGELVTIDREKINTMTDYKGTGKPHPLKGQKGTSKNMYYVYYDKSGRPVKVKMNMAMLTPRDADMIVDELEKYALSQNRDEYIVDTSKHPLLSKLGDIKFFDPGAVSRSFLSFFLTPQGGQTSSPLFVKNTFKLNVKGMKDGKFKFSILNEGFSILELTIPAADGTAENTAKIKEIISKSKEELKQIILEQRHNFNVNFARSKEGLAYMIDNKIVNHAFNVSNNFDNIYDRGTYDAEGERTGDYNRGIVISRADVDDQYKSFSKKTIAQKLEDLRGTIQTKEGKYEANLKDLANSIYDGIRHSISIRIAKERENLAKLDKEKLLNDAIDSVINNRIKEVLSIVRDHPGMITPERDHENANGKTISSDTALDQMLIWLYAYKTLLSENKTWRKNIMERMDHWNALREFLQSFKSPPAGANFSMINFVPNSEGTEVTNNMRSEEQVESIMKMINVLKELTERPGIRFIDINYSEAFYNKNTDKVITASRKFLDNEGLKKSQLTNAHYKSRLKSVQIVEQPRWENGKLVAGEVYFNLGTLSSEGKEGNQHVLVLSKDTPLERSTNIMTSISLPFLSTTTFKLSDNFDKMVQDIYDNIGIDTKLRIVLEGEMPKPRKVKAKPSKDQDILEEVGLDVPEVGAKKDKPTLNLRTLDSDVATGFFEELGNWAKETSGKPNKEDQTEAKKFLKELGVSNLSTYLAAIDHYEKKGLLKKTEDIIAFGEATFKEKREDCE